jgi:outer membrane protein assembly factor BamD
MKSSDNEYKLKMAKKWYAQKAYAKCIPLLEEQMGLMKGQASTEELYYMYCQANYNLGDYMIAAYHFKNFYTAHPLSDHAEECLFMNAICNDRLSPRYDLDPNYTTKAIDAYQNFLNQYNDSKWVDSANRGIVNLRKKLERKALSNAELYYKTSNFKAAAVSFEALLTQYPDIDNVERILYMAVKSYAKFADNSIPSKRTERFHNVIKSYKNFVYKFQNSKLVPELKNYEQDAHYQAAISAYQWAEYASTTDREKQYLYSINESEEQAPLIIDAKRQAKCKDLIERAHVDIVRLNCDLAAAQYDTSQVLQNERKLDFYNHAIQNYYTFVDKYKGSRYAREAEKLYTLATNNISKLKQNGQKQKD